MHATRPPGSARDVRAARRVLWLAAAVVGAGAAAQPDDASPLSVDGAPSADVGAPSEAPDRRADPDDASAAEITPEDVETFAKIYVALEREARRFERAIANAESDEDAQKIQARLQTESLAVLDDYGWTAEKFDRVARALNARPDLAADALRRIDDER